MNTDYEIDNEDKSIYQQAMDENASLRAQLAEKDKKIELIKDIADNFSYKLKIANLSFNSEHRVAETFRILAEKAEAENAELCRENEVLREQNFAMNKTIAELRKRLKPLEDFWNIWCCCDDTLSPLSVTLAQNECFQAIRRAVGK